MMTLVLLPGLDGTGQLFKDFVTALGPGIKTITVAYPPDAPLGYAELEPIARSFLPQGEPYYLLAESFSGPVAIAIAASSPPGLRGLILSCSFARSPQPLLAYCRFAIRFVPVKALPTALFSFFLLGRFRSAALLEAFAKSLATVAPAVLRARAHAALSIDVCAALSRVRVPLLYLRATEDRVVPRHSSKIVVSLAAHTQVAGFAAPHFLLQVLPSQTAATVAGFMGVRSVQPAPPASQPV